MKWVVVLFVLVTLLCSVLADGEGGLDVRGAADYTGNYAELAAPVPASVNEQEVVASLLRAAEKPLH